MTSLDKARQGKSAARQIRSLARTNCLTGPELIRLLDVVDAGFEQMMPSEGRQALKGAFTVIDGARH